MSEPTTPSIKTAEELQSDIAKLESDKLSLVGETQELRKSRQEKDEEIVLLKEALKASTDKNNASPEEEKIAAVVQKLLGNETQKSAEKNRKAAFDKFVSENKEYHADNDGSGLKLAALEKEFNQFNTSNLVETEDFIKVIGKANALLRGTDTQRQIETTETPYSSSSSNPAAPGTVQPAALSDTEKKLIERNGWTAERYLALKAKMPDMIDDLIASARP